jgi:hypothetical protein
LEHLDRFSDGHSALPHQAIIFAWGGMFVCDGCHWLVVIKNIGGLVSPSDKNSMIERAV